MNGLLALAFAAGMVAPVNPCGFALLPAWIAATLGEPGSSALPLRLARSLRSGAALTLGFTATLAGAGVAASAGARSLISAAPRLGFATGAALLLLGAVMFTGRSPGLRLPAIARHRSDAPSTVGRMALFGAGYAAASLSCSFGVLLAVIAQAQASTGQLGLLAVFAAYTAGAAAILLLVAITTAIAGATLTRRITALARHGTRVTAAVLVLTGAYLAWYWYPAATGASPTGSSRGLTGFTGALSTWIQAHTTTIAALAALAVLAVGAAAVRHRTRTASPKTPAPPSGSTAADRDTSELTPQTVPAAAVPPDQARPSDHCC